MFCIISYQPCSAGDIIRIATGEWPPYISQELKHQGMITRIIKNAFELENITAEFTFFPWKRSKVLTQRGDWDACSVWARVKLMEKDFYFSDVVADGRLVFFHPKNINFTWDSLKDLQHYRVGAVLGSVHNKEFQQAEKKGLIKTYYKPSELDVMKLLIHGNVEVFGINKRVGYFLLNKYFSEDEVKLITHNPKPMRTSQYVLIFSKKVEKNKKYLQLFNQGLQKLKESGQYEQYLQEATTTTGHTMSDN